MVTVSTLLKLREAVKHDHFMANVTTDLENAKGYAGDNGHVIWYHRDHVHDYGGGYGMVDTRDFNKANHKTSWGEVGKDEEPRGLHSYRGVSAKDMEKIRKTGKHPISAVPLPDDNEVMSHLGYSDEEAEEMSRNIRS